MNVNGSSAERLVQMKRVAMAASRAVRQSKHLERLRESVSERSRVLPLMEQYLERTGMTMPDFARRINYSPQTLSHFRSDRYHYVAATHKRLCQAIEQFITTSPIGAPGRLFGDLYPTKNCEVIRSTFDALLRRPVAYMIYAPPGSQKSFVLEHLVAELNHQEIASGGDRRAFYVYARVKARPNQLMKEVAIACGTCCLGDRLRVLQNLQLDFRQRRVLLVVDEAQHLSLDCFEALRELLDRPPHFSLLFSGSHDLKAIFDRFSATLEQWNSRLVDKVSLPGIQREEATAIVRREIGDWLDALPADTAKKRMQHLIEASMSEDVFTGRRKYINVRTLTNALDQLRLKIEAATSKNSAKLSGGAHV